MPAADAARPQAGPASTRWRATQNVKLGLNKSVVIDLPADAYDILVANPAVADAVTRTARRIYLFGKAVGETNIFVFGPNGEQIVSLDLAVERDVAGVEEYIKRFIPTSDIKVELINDNVVLTGTVDTPLDASPRCADRQHVRERRRSDDRPVFADGRGQQRRRRRRHRQSRLERQVSGIVNLIQIIGEDQVMLKVTVAEVSRNVMKQLGVNLIGRRQLQRHLLGRDQREPASAWASRFPRRGLSIGTAAIDAYLNAMEQAGVMKTLAEPTLTAVSGEKATFRVGGEFNLVTGRVQSSDDNRTGQSRTTVEKLEYGIGLEFQPVVLSPGRISLKVRTSVSEPTNEGVGAALSGGFRASSTRSGSRHDGAVDPQAPRRHHGRTALRRLDDDRRPGPRRCQAGGQRTCPACRSCRCSARCSAAGISFATRPNSSSSSRPISPGRLRATSSPSRTTISTPRATAPAMFLGRVNRVYGTMQTELAQRPLSRRRRLHLQMSGVTGHVRCCVQDAAEPSTSGGHGHARSCWRWLRSRFSPAAPKRDSITVGAVPDDYRTNHPIMIAEKEEALDLPVGASDRGVTHSQRASLDGFLAGYDKSRRAGAEHHRADRLRQRGRRRGRRAATLPASPGRTACRQAAS